MTRTLGNGFESMAFVTIPITDENNLLLRHETEARKLSHPWRLRGGSQEIPYIIPSGMSLPA